MFQTAHRWSARRINGLTFGDLLLTPRFERGGMVEKARQRIVPTWPVPPAMIIFIARKQRSTRSLCADDNERSTFSPRFAHPAERVRSPERTDSVTTIHKQSARMVPRLDGPGAAHVLGISATPTST